MTNHILPLNKVNVKFAFNDENDLHFYKDENENLFAFVDGIWHSCTREGEPAYPTMKEISIVK
jgi:hypothetical protein